MEYSYLIEQIQTVAICQETIAELVGASYEGNVNTKKVAILLDFLAMQQTNFIGELIHKGDWENSLYRKS